MNQNANAKREFPYVKLVLIVTLVLVVAIVGYSIVDTVGIIAHLNTAAKSDNFKFNENIVDVYRYIIPASAMSADNLYFYMAYGPNMGISNVYTYLEYSVMPGLGQMAVLFANNLQSSGSLYGAYYNAMATSIELGYFDYVAYAQAREVIAYCEGAREAGLYDDYKKETAEDVEDYIDAFTTTAKSMGITLRTFLKRYMGDGVSKKDLRKALEYQFVAGKYAEKIQEDYEAAATIDEIKAYIEKNKSSFYTSTYYAVTLATKELKEALDKCKTLEEMEKAVAEYYFEKNYKAAYDKEFGKAEDKKVVDPTPDKTKADILTTVLAMNKIGDAKEVFTAADKVGKDDYKKAARKVADAVNTSTATDKVSIKSMVAKINDSRTDSDPVSSAYVDTSVSGTTYTDLQKWLFDSARKQNDFKIITETSTSSSSSTSSSTTTTTTYKLYIAEDIMKLDTEKTKVGYYLTLTDDKQETETTENGETVFVETESALLTAGDKVQAMYDVLKDLTDDEEEFAEKFAELAEKYAPGTTTYFYEMLSYKSASSTVKDWFYNENRKPGDLAILPLDKAETSADDKKDDETSTIEPETDAVTEPETDAMTESETDAETSAETGKEVETAKPETETTKKKTTIAFFQEENKETWEMNGRTSVANEKRADWLEAAYEKYNVDVDYKFPSAESSTAETKAETTAGTTATTQPETSAATKEESKAA